MDDYYPAFFKEAIKKPSARFYGEEMGQFPKILEFLEKNKIPYTVYLLSLDIEPLSKVEPSYGIEEPSLDWFEVKRSEVMYRECLKEVKSHRFCAVHSGKFEVEVLHEKFRILWIPPVLGPGLYAQKTDYSPAVFLVVDAPRYFLYGGGTPNSSLDRTSLAELGKILSEPSFTKKIRGSYLIFVDGENNLHWEQTAEKEVLGLPDLLLGKNSKIREINIDEFVNRAKNSGKRVKITDDLPKKFWNAEEYFSPF